jgi:cystathionine beta-lyase/cystathionine gamma-synthase
MLQYIKKVLEHMPADWLNLTTHRLDIYNEPLAKTQFLQEFENLYNANIANTEALDNLPTAFDYIRLGHPLSCVLEWATAGLNRLDPESVVAFSSRATPILAILRKNAFAKKATKIFHRGPLPDSFDVQVLHQVYQYEFEVAEVDGVEEIKPFDGSVVFVSLEAEIGKVASNANIDFFVCLHEGLGSILYVNGAQNQAYISEIQHVRRRETIAMTPANCLIALEKLVGKELKSPQVGSHKSDRDLVQKTILEITGTQSKALIGSSGLSVQYAIMMGLIHHAFETYPGKAIKIIVPPNCYGGTNDQARRVAACVSEVEILDLPVDGDNNMVQSIDVVLNAVAHDNAIPFIIAEIPTNPRVEVPDIDGLKSVLSKKRFTPSGELAMEPVFILDQTFCPNVQFLGADHMLASVQTISYVSGSKFPSGGKCTAGYCVANPKAAHLLEKIEKHLQLCDNAATRFQMEILANQMPSMNARILKAYQNTRAFVEFIKEVLPAAKINFVSDELARQGFTPSVFSLDLPTKGSTHEEREAFKRALNLKLIHLMISEIPDESKFCVSYGQLKGCYWTIPATSTQGTTKERDKDYIVRVALSPEMDLESHKRVFANFVASMEV